MDNALCDPVYGLEIILSEILVTKIRNNKYKLSQKAWSVLSVYKIVILTKIRPPMHIAAF